MAEPATVIAVEEKGAAKLARSKPAKPLPTNRIKFNKQLDLLRAYVAASGTSGKPVGNKEVADIAGMVETTVSLANSFFCAVGLLQRVEGGFLPSQDAANFKRAYDWKPEGAAHKLAPAIRSSWFGEALLPKLEFGPMEQEDALARLAEIASASPEYKPQLEVLVEYMCASGVVDRDGSMIKLSKAAPQASVDLPPTPEQEAGPPKPSVPKGSVDTTFSQPTQHLVQFQISVTVDGSEMNKWTPERITALFAGIAQVLAAKAGLEKSASGH
jgi:hypothetical protein